MDQRCNGIITPGTAFKQLFLTKFTTTVLMNRWQLEYRNCVQRTGETIGEYITRFTKALQRLENATPLPMNIKIMDFIGGLNHNTAAIVGGTNPATLTATMDIVINVESLTSINR